MLIATLRGGYFFALNEDDFTSICSGRGSYGLERKTSHYEDKPLGANKKTEQRGSVFCLSFAETAV
jgi:hypothetical protein